MVKSTSSNTGRRGNKKNLRPPWKKGESGNPKGRPTKEECITSIVKEMLEQIHPDDPKKRTWKQLVAEAMLRHTVKGKGDFMKEVLNRTEGKVAQPLTGLGGTPLFPENPFDDMTDDELKAEAIKRGYVEKK